MTLLQATLGSPLGDVAFLVGRLLFGLVLAFMGVNHFANAAQMVGYTEAKGVPAAGLLVPFTGGLLVFGGVGLAVGAFPVLAAGAIATFLLVTTSAMHDFWAVPEEQRQSEMTDFLKNVALLGGALTLFALGGTDWPYAVNVGLF